MNNFRSNDNERLFTLLYECYLGAIDSVRQHAVDIHPGELTTFRASLSTLHRRLFEDRSVEALESARQEFDREVCQYNEKVTQMFHESKAEIHKIVGLLNGTMENLADRNRSYDDEFSNITSELETTALTDDLRQIRLLLTTQVDELRKSFTAMRRDNNALIVPLQNQVQHFEERLKEAELAAALDPLTGLFNRREGERQAQRLLQRGATFCLLILDLNRFKSMNDRFGHACGDQVLRQFAKKLETSVRPSDTVCRWGGDEFMIVMECNLNDAMQRSRQMGTQLQGKYPVVSQGRRLEVDVGAAIGVAQCQPGDSIDIAFERADTMLYQIKNKNK